MVKFESEMYNKGYDDGFSDAAGEYETESQTLKKIVQVVAAALLMLCAYKYGAAHPEMMNEHYINMQTVTDIGVSEGGFYLHLEDGTGYFWEYGGVEE